MRNLFVFALLCFGFTACNSNGKSTTGEEKTQRYENSLSGNTMGTTYHITYVLDSALDLSVGVDSVLKAVNMSLSTYIDSSTISRFNQSATGLVYENTDADPMFAELVKQARGIYATTNGAFDPTVMPLVNYWGFGYDNLELTDIDSQEVAYLHTFVGYDKVKDITIQDKDEDGNIKTVTHSFKKLDTGVQLDFSAIAKGYGVDVVADYLLMNGVEDFMVEIGGELVVRGLNPDTASWKIAIEKPMDDGSREMQEVLGLKDCGMATSGNYRNYKIIDGQKVVHTINPKTGFPEISNLLSATVIAPNCATADGYATAFMVMGLSEAYKLALEDETLEAYFIYSDENGDLAVKYTPGMEDLILKQDL